MQIISKILKITGGSGCWVTQYDKRISDPEVVVGVAAKLRFDLRCDQISADQTLAPYPAGELNSDALYLVLDMDYDHTTSPKLLLSGDVALTSGKNGETFLDAVLPNTATTDIIAALAKQKSISIHGEIGGYSAGNGAALADWAIGFDITLRNRVWLGGDVPPEISGDPEYLTAVQVQALIAEATRSEVPGKSAYQIAVDNGFDGSETEWLASLKGSDAEDGKTAYQIAVDNGFDGSETEWLASLKGSDAEDGKTAYQIAVDNGFDGSVSAWLESLKGEPGEPGNDLRIDATGEIEELNDYAGEPKGFIFASSAYDDTRRATVVSLYAKRSGDYGDWCTPIEIVYYEKPAVVTALEPIEFSAPEDGAAYLTFSLKDYPSAIISQVAVDITPENGSPYELLLPHGLANGVRRIEHDRSSGDCRIYFGASVPEFTGGRIYMSEFLGVKTVDVSSIPSAVPELSGQENYDIVCTAMQECSVLISVISNTGNVVQMTHTSGVLPDGLTFSGNRIYGTPKAACHTTAVITATSTSGARKVIRVNIIVQTAGEQPGTGIMYYGYLTDGTVEVSAITEYALARDTVKSAVLSALGKTAVNAPPGALIVAAIPAASPLAAYKDDGFGGKVSFDADLVPGSGANGEKTVTLNGELYKLYGEFNLVNAPTYIYIE